MGRFKKGLIRISNRNEVKNINNIQRHTEIKEDGRVIVEQLIGGLDVAPGREVVFDVSRPGCLR